MDAERNAASASPASLSIQEVAAQLEQIALTSAARAFCALLWQRTLGSGTAWCEFDLAEWSAALGWTKAQRSNLRRIRDALVQRNIIVFTPDPLVAGKGRIGWTLDVARWQPYDRRTRAQQKQARLVKYAGQLTNHACSESPQITNHACLTDPQITNHASLQDQQITNHASLEEHAPIVAAPDDAAPSPNAHAVPQDQLTQWQADLMEQRQHVANLRQAWQAAVAAWEHCLPGTEKVRLHREANLAEAPYREEEERLALFERFLALIAAGHTKEAALAALQATESPDPASSANAEVTGERDDPLGPPEDDAAPPASPTPLARLEGTELRKALFATLVRLFLGETPDPTDVTLERGKYNRAIKRFTQKQVQPDDLVALKATFERVWPRATCTALALANNLPFLMQKAREVGYAFGEETPPGDA